MNAPAAPAPHPLPRARWVALAFFLIWAPSYAATWGWRNFLHLCDVTVFLTLVGLWRGSPALVGGMASASFVVNLAWVIDVAARAATGRHLIGGTEYMWDGNFPLAVRLLSLFHLALPVVHVLAVRRLGYPRRALAIAAAVCAASFVVSFVVSDPVENLNFVFAEPFARQRFGPPVVHLLVTIVGFIALAVLPIDLLLRRFARPRPAA